MHIQHTPLRLLAGMQKIASKKRRISVECPKVVHMYNSYMGEVDRFDKNTHAQRISFRNKKWWFPLFAFGIDASCQTAWNLYKNINGKKSRIANIDARLFSTI